MVPVSPTPDHLYHILTHTHILSHLHANSAEAVITAKVGFVTVITQTVDTCESAAKDGMPCPIKKGFYNLSTEYVVPADAPKVPFTLTVIGKGERIE